MIYNNIWFCKTCQDFSTFTIGIISNLKRKSTKMVCDYRIECYCNGCGRKLEPDYIKRVNYLLEKSGGIDHETIQRINSTSK